MISDEQFGEVHSTIDIAIKEAIAGEHYRAVRAEMSLACAIHEGNMLKRALADLLVKPTNFGEFNGPPCIHAFKEGQCAECGAFER